MDEIVVISDTEEDNSNPNNQCSGEKTGKGVTSINKDMIKIVDIDSIIQSKPPQIPSTTIAASTVLSPLKPIQGPPVQYKKLILPTSFAWPNNGLKPHNLQAIQIEGSKNIYLLNIDKRFIQATSKVAKITTSTSSNSASTLVSTSSSMPTLVNCLCSTPIVSTSAPISPLVPTPAIIPTIVPASVHIPPLAPISTRTAPRDVRTIHYKCLESKKTRRKIDYEGFTSNDRLGFSASEERRSHRCLRNLNMHIKVRENYLSLLESRRLEYAKEAKMSTAKVDDLKTVGNAETNRTRKKGSTNVNKSRKRRRGNVKRNCSHDIKLSDNSTRFYNIKMCTSQEECCRFQCVQLPINYEKLTYSQLMTTRNHSNIYYIDSTNIHDVDNIKAMEPSSNIYFINENNLVTDYYMDSIPFLKDKVKVIDKCVFNKYTKRIEPKPTRINHERSAASRKRAFNSFLTKFHGISKKK